MRDVLQEVLPSLPVVRRLIDSLALLDMLASFAQVQGTLELLPPRPQSLLAC